MKTAMDDLKAIVCRELEEIAQKGEMSAGELDTVYKLVMTKEKLLRIEELEENLGYSESGGDWRAEGSYGRYDRDSYARNSRNSYGRHYVRGHYSRGYSMADGKEMVVDQIRELMEDPSLSSSDKAALNKAMEQLRR